MFIEILFKILLFKGGVLIYAEHCVCIYIYIYIYNCETRVLNYFSLCALNLFKSLVLLIVMILAHI